MARVRVRVNCGPTWPIAPLRRDAKRVARRRREGTSAAALPPTPCSRLRAPTTPRSEMAAPASTECRHPEASKEAIGGSAGVAAGHMHAATAGVVAAARAEPPAEISKKLQD